MGYKERYLRRKELFDKGYSIKQVAEKENASIRTIYEWAKNYGYTDGRKKAREKNNKTTDRMEKFIAIMTNYSNDIKDQNQVSEIIKLVKNGVFDNCRVVSKNE